MIKGIGRWGGAFACALTVGSMLHVGSARADDMKVQIWAPRDAQSSGALIIAQEKGFFKKAGLDSELKFVSSGQEIPAGMQSGWESRASIPMDVAVSLLRVVEGFAIAAVTGVLLGCLSASSRLAENILDPILEVLRPIPPLAFLPIFIIWFGLGEMSKILMIAFATFFTIYVNTYQGVRYADPLLMRAALSLGAKPRQAFFTIGLPSAMPEIFTGLRLGMGMAFFVLVAAELLAADSGMGYRIQEARWQFRVDRMFFGAALIGFVGYLLLWALKKLEERLLDWKPIRQAP